MAAHGDFPSIGVLLVNTGTPAAPTRRATRRFLRRFLMDKRIAPMNRFVWWFILTFVILRKRSGASAAKYQQIWTEEGAPFMRVHERITAGLQAYYDRVGVHAHVALGMSYSEPSIIRSIRGLQKLGCSRLVVLPLYPQSAHSTTESVKDSVSKAIRKTHWRGDVDVIEDYHDNPIYIKAIAASIKNAGFDVQGEDRILFSYHSIPITDIEQGDTYELQTDASSLMVASELGVERRRWTIAYQCRFDKSRDWLQPFTKDTLSRWARAGEGRVFVVCPNFAVDCLETTYDVEHELRHLFFEAARQAGSSKTAREFIYVPCLNASKAHLRVLADILRPYVERELS